MKKTMDHQLQHLEGKHQMLDTEVEHLMNRTHLTPDEYQHALELKKRKLMLKDDIQAIRQDRQR
jgi:hypothetical protein